MDIVNGMPAAKMPELEFVNASGPNGGNCVDFADLPDGNVGVRNSRDPEGAMLVFTRAEIAAMANGFGPDGVLRRFAS